MKRFNTQMLHFLVALLSLSATGCSAPNEKSATNARSELVKKAETRDVLEDGVYPVVATGNATAKDGRKSNVVELMNVPVDGSGDSAPDKIRLIPRPLVRFRDVSQFDFTFANNECTEVGFQNTAELKAYTRNHVGSRLALVIGNKVISHHKIREAIESDEVRITCCTAGGGDHLHKNLKKLKIASDAKRRSKAGF